MQLLKFNSRSYYWRKKIFHVFINTKELLKDDRRRKAEIDRVVEEVLLNSKDYDVCGIIGDGIMSENRLNLKEFASHLRCTVDEVSTRINDAFAEITYQILKRNNYFKGLYTSGGDITVAVSRKFKTVGIRLLDEVVPLAAYGEFISGEFDGLKVITKGGMAGDKSAINVCVRYLKEKLYM